MDKIYAGIVAFFAGLWPGGNAADNAAWFGYVEGEYVYVAAQASGVLETLAVARGDAVTADTPLFDLDRDKQENALAQARAELVSAQKDLEDETTGKRPEEIAVIEKQLNSAKADLELAKASYLRASELEKRNVVATSELDRRKAERDAADAAVAQRMAELDVARLPARQAELDRARSAVDKAKLAVERADIDLGERMVTAPATGYVEQTYYLPGEFVTAGAPVVSILPPGEVRFRFYVPEPQRAAIRIGMPVEISCDGCGEPVKAHISYLSSSAEFTPPVIYSLDERAKLIFLAEALPDEQTDLLPGQPIEVRRTDEQ
ncbi:HlyD family efflux transporter periplasmic adaptor subunit [Hoeflea sp. WL0058]|uniref:HlyD family efflux transporter periplasmic adaptor subunit n=1 Tax=Flavimaribacter sediminis TaxID=2865987 RepID=A0AAE3D2C8_9HYPH|nr:HlyD family efflux transporter periplasmic adaptor subunit [Flavimaribacter sediminis]MBW8638483.1 HlyD family efflux transporter periplasmic adaptor subunit [Flavimaribacter sediminis]